MNPITQTIKETMEWNEKDEKNWLANMLFASDQKLTETEWKTLLVLIEFRTKIKISLALSKQKDELLKVVVGVVEKAQAYAWSDEHDGYTDDKDSDWISKKDILTELQGALKELKDKK